MNNSFPSFVLAVFLCPFTTLYAQNTESLLSFTFSEIVTSAEDNRERAVAFHTIHFIDSLGKSLGEVILGNEEANIQQDEGWYRNEHLPRPGLFQWTGRSGAQATIQVDIPEETKGLLLDVKAVRDSIWMAVLIDDQYLAARRVDKYWHSVYIPMGEIQTSPVPAATPEWVDDRVFPVFPTGDIIYGFSVPTPLAQGDHGAWWPNWRANQSFDVMMCLTLVSMQGLINRHGSRVYV